MQQRKEKKLKVFDMIADMKADKELRLSHWIAIEKQKAEHFTVFIPQSYFKVLKTIRTNNLKLHHENT